MNQLSQEKAKPQQAPSIQEAEARERSAGAADQLVRLIALERQARRSETRQELAFTIVNWTHRLIPYYQALFFRTSAAGRRPVLEAVSAVATVDRNTPFTLWAVDFCRALIKANPELKLSLASPEKMEPGLVEGWQQWLPPHILFCPLKNRQGDLLGVLLLAREEAFQAAELSLSEMLIDTYGHALSTFHADRKKGLAAISAKKRRTIGLGVFAAILALLFLIRIPETVLAPAEIVPKEPIIVTSPVKGQIRNIDVQPYQMVKKGQLLFHLDDTEMVNQLNLAQKNLQVVQAEYLRAEQKAFSDPLSKADLEVLRVQAEEKALIVNYSQEELERQKITASQDGMVLFSDRNDWIGRPVAIGEKVMTLADPGRAEIQILMPVDDAISLEQGAAVKFFLRTDPLNPIAATISRTSFKAEERPGGGMFFPLKAEFNYAGQAQRIGLQGTAKVYGGTVSLFYYIFRKPLAVIRREAGL